MDTFRDTDHTRPSPRNRPAGPTRIVRSTLIAVGALATAAAMAVWVPRIPSATADWASGQNLLVQPSDIPTFAYPEPSSTTATFLTQLLQPCADNNPLISQIVTDGPNVTIGAMLASTPIDQGGGPPSGEGVASVAFNADPATTESAYQLLSTTSFWNCVADMWVQTGTSAGLDYQKLQVVSLPATDNTGLAASNRIVVKEMTSGFNATTFNNDLDVVAIRDDQNLVLLAFVDNSGLFPGTLRAQLTALTEGRIRNFIHAAPIPAASATTGTIPVKTQTPTAPTKPAAPPVERWIAPGVAVSGGTAVVVFAGIIISRRTRLVEPRPIQPEPTDPLSSDPPATVRGVRPSEVEPSHSAINSVDDRVGPDGLQGTVTAASENAADGPRLRVRLMGPLEIEGTTAVIRRKLVLHALLVLAVNLGRSVSADELRFNLATSEDHEPSPGTLRSELSRLRQVLPSGLLPEREPGAGYAFLADQVEVDWVTFTHFANRYRASADLRDALDALRLVRGPVLAHHTWHGIDKTIWEMTVQIERLAVQAATHALKIGQPQIAAEATAQGLLAVPGSPGLWELRRDAAHGGSGENIDYIQTRAKAELGYTMLEPG